MLRVAALVDVDWWSYSNGAYRAGSTIFGLQTLQAT